LNSNLASIFEHGRLRGNARYGLLALVVILLFVALAAFNRRK
jgi:hypothetical protein